MRFGIAAPNWGPFGDPRAAVELAGAAEQAGWDGYFSWDALIVRSDPPPTHDPWTILAAVAAATERIRVGTCIAVLARYKPHLVARTLASLDVLSDGRLTLGVGIGDGGRHFEAFGEPGDARIRAEKLDEALEVITKLWSGDEITHHGTHYTVEGYALTALPVQRPRVPIWVGGDSPAAMRRAARWDGWIGPDHDPLSGTAEDLTAVRHRLGQAGASLPSFDIAWAGKSDPGQDGSVTASQRAGATWWIEVATGSREETLARITAGPPEVRAP